MKEIIYSMIIPFLGTALGSACVFFMRNALNSTVHYSMTGFAAGIMTAASIWSLIIPAINQETNLGKLAFFPAAAGFMTGIIIIMITNKLISQYSDCQTKKLSKETMLILAVIIHNIPEGMAVGAACAGLIYGTGSISSASVMALALGIGIQNFPEGAIISMPLRICGKSRLTSFAIGIISGIAELLGAAFMLLAANLILPFLPYLLSFAAGAMIYVVVEELIPEMTGDNHSDAGIIAFSIGFTFMMILDVALG